MRQDIRIAGLIAVLEIKGLCDLGLYSSPTWPQSPHPFTKGIE